MVFALVKQKSANLQKQFDKHKTLYRNKVYIMRLLYNFKFAFIRCDQLTLKCDRLTSNTLIYASSDCH